MKKRSFLLVLAVLFSLVLNAQNLREINGKRIYFIHVLLEFEGKTKGQASIDYGFNNSIYARGKYAGKITDANGNPLVFNSKLSMINYMTLQGWTYMDSMEEVFKSTYWSTFAKEVSAEEAKEILSKLATPKLDEPEKGKKK